MTTRREIEKVVREYGNVPRDQLPSRFRDPRNEHDFNLAMALMAASTPGVEPLYNDDDQLTSWKGIRLKSQ